jgi:YebC/PmpR family DNA-binding regulatory protein
VILFYIAAGILAVVLMCVYVSWRAGRLDRLHHRVDAARTALDLALVRRSSSAYELASSGLLDPATSLLLADAARRTKEDDGTGASEGTRASDGTRADHGAAADHGAGASDGAAADHGTRDSDTDGPAAGDGPRDSALHRELAESDLTRALRAAFSQPQFRESLAEVDGAEELVGEVEAAAHQVFLARKFYNDIAARTIEARLRPLVRAFRLAGHAPRPAFFEMDDVLSEERLPPGAVRSTRSGMTSSRATAFPVADRRYTSFRFNGEGNDMSGHSKWATTKHKKAVVDAKRGKLFAKLIKNIEVAARTGGGDPTGNPTLYDAIQKAKKSSVPNDNIDRATRRGAGLEAGGAQYENITYEGYGPGGVAVLVHCLTDNRNRAASDVRVAFTRNGGRMADPGSVAYMFNRKGVVIVNKTGNLTEDDILGAVLDANAEEVNDLGDTFEVISEPQDMIPVRTALQDAGIDYESADAAFLPTSETALDEEQARKVFKLIDALEDSDDVQDVYANYSVSDEIMEKLDA